MIGSTFGGRYSRLRLTASSNANIRRPLKSSPLCSGVADSAVKLNEKNGLNVFFSILFYFEIKGQFFQYLLPDVSCKILFSCASLCDKALVPIYKQYLVAFCQLCKLTLTIMN